MQVRHAGKYRLLIRLCCLHQNVAKVEVRLHKVLGQGLHGKAGIGRYLIVRERPVCRRLPASPMRRVSSLSIAM